VVGLGAMGAGIAQLCIEAGVDTVGREISMELAEKGRDGIASASSACISSILRR
jgi:3-hydroxyacyl-CoA dehydrogenase